MDITALKEYAANGGTLILSGVPGNQDELCHVRSLQESEKLWGIPLVCREQGTYKVHSCGQGRICVISNDFGYHGTPEEIRGMFGVNHMDFPYCEMPYELIKSIGFICANNCRLENTRTPSMIGTLYEGFQEKGPEICALIRKFLPEPAFYAELPELVLAVPFQSQKENTLTIRLLNAAGTLFPPDGSTVSHDDPIPWEKWKGRDARITIALPMELRKTLSAEFCTLDGTKENLVIEQESGHAVILLPAGLLKNFGMITVSQQ